MSMTLKDVEELRDACTQARHQFDMYDDPSTLTLLGKALGGNFLGVLDDVEKLIQERDALKAILKGAMNV